MGYLSVDVVGSGALRFKKHNPKVRFIIIEGNEVNAATRKRNTERCGLTDRAMDNHVNDCVHWNVDKL